MALLAGRLIMRTDVILGTDCDNVVNALKKIGYIKNYRHVAADVSAYALAVDPHLASPIASIYVKNDALVVCQPSLVHLYLLTVPDRAAKIGVANSGKAAFSAEGNDNALVKSVCPIKPSRSARERAVSLMLPLAVKVLPSRPFKLRTGIFASRYFSHKITPRISNYN